VYIQYIDAFCSCSSSFSFGEWVCLRQTEIERNVIDRWKEEWMKMGGEKQKGKEKILVRLLLFVCLKADEPKDHRSVSFLI
jgi:hypothetical protein